MEESIPANMEESIPDEYIYTFSKDDEIEASSSFKLVPVE